MKKTGLLLLIFILISPLSPASDWANWRGPNYNGTTDETNLPDTLDLQENLLWSTPLPGPASSTPIITTGKVFLNSTEKDSKNLLALCLDADTGNQLWQKTISEGNEKFWRNTMSSCSPVAGKENVYFLFADGTVACLDYDGNQIWKRNLVEAYGPLNLKFGYSSSPLLYEDKLYISVLNYNKSYRGPKRDDLQSYLLALDTSTGETIFRQLRPTDAREETQDAYTSPLPLQIDKQVQILLYGADYLTGHDPQTGRELWRYQFDTSKQRMGRIIPTPVITNSILYCVHSRGKKTFAFSPEKFMNKQEPLLWEIEYPGPDVACQVVYKGSLYSLDDREDKTLSCLDSATGKLRWISQLDKSDAYYSSITAADDKLYLLNIKGVLSVVAADPDEFKLLSQTKLGQDPIHSSVAIANGKIYIRTAETLYCFGKIISKGRENET